MIDLPKDYLQQMNQLLSDDQFRAFIQTYKQPATRGLRVNTLKITPETLNRKVPFRLEAVAWCPTGFYFDSTDRPGLHPYHQAGLYYIQEPSAMAVVELLDPQPGERILDLCAAPGGKSTHIASKLNGKGWLVANDIHNKRVKVLTENLERWGVTNATILNAAPEQLTDRFHQFFDRILIDAPCSGEGMFRKNNTAITEWSERVIAHCVARQRHLLQAAVPMLRPGGRLVYSTCTFNDQENEMIVDYALTKFRELTLVENANMPFPFSPALPLGDDDLPRQSVYRLWPHKHKGEGHFIAIFQKEKGLPQKRTHPHIDRKHKKRGYRIMNKLPDEWHAFESETFDRPITIQFPIMYGSHLFEINPDLPPLDDIRVIRPGFYIGQLKKKRFEPSHALALTDRKTHVQRRLDFPSEACEQIQAYVRGETFTLNTSGNGWTLVTVDGYAIGWGKQSTTILKNHFPKSLRKG